MLSYDQDEDGQWWAYTSQTDGTIRRSRVAPRTCEACGEEYVRFGKPGRFCSRKCSGRTVAKESIAKRPSYTCQQCGESFWKPDKRSVQFCSQECKGLARRGKHRKVEPDRECPGCGTMFNREVGRPWRKTCGCRTRNPSGSEHPRWKGGKDFTDGNGYVRVHTATGRKLEHRAVMEEILGRPLERYEEVHHKNAIRDDNRPENLELWVKRQPGGARAKDLLDYARWVLATYGPVEDKLSS